MDNTVLYLKLSIKKLIFKPDKKFLLKLLISTGRNGNPPFIKFIEKHNWKHLLKTEQSRQKERKFP